MVKDGSKQEAPKSDSKSSCCATALPVNHQPKLTALRAVLLNCCAESAVLLDSLKRVDVLLHGAAIAGLHDVLA
jgi:hypothetical protein